MTDKVDMNGDPVVEERTQLLEFEGVCEQSFLHFRLLDADMDVDSAAWIHRALAELMRDDLEHRVKITIELED